MADKEYELKVPMVVDSTTRHEAGDKVKLSEARARELIEQGVVVDPNASDDDAPGEPGGQTTAPGVDADGDGEPDSGDDPDQEPDGAGGESTIPEGAPERGAAKAKWIEWTTSDGAGDHKLEKADAEVLTRDQLAERVYGPATS